MIISKGPSSGPDKKQAMPGANQTTRLISQITTLSALVLALSGGCSTTDNSDKCPERQTSEQGDCPISSVSNDTKQSLKKVTDPAKKQTDTTTPADATDSVAPEDTTTPADAADSVAPEDTTTPADAADTADPEDTENAKKLMSIELYGGYKIEYRDLLPSIDNAISTYSYILDEKNKIIPKGERHATYIDSTYFRIIGTNARSGEGEEGMGMKGDFLITSSSDDPKKLDEEHDDNRIKIKASWSSHPDQKLVIGPIDTNKDTPLVSTNMPEESERPGLQRAQKNARKEITINGEKHVLIEYIYKTTLETFKKTGTYKRLNSVDSRLAQRFIELVILGLVAQESEYDNSKTSSAGAKGLFQLTNQAIADILLNYPEAQKLTGAKTAKEIDATNYTQSAQIQPFHFDLTHDWLIKKLGEDHAYFKLPEEVQMLMLIQAYNNGKGRATQIIQYFFKQYPNEDKTKEKYFNSKIPNFYIEDDGTYKEDLILFMLATFMEGCLENKPGTSQRYGSDSHQYLAKILAWQSLMKDIEFDDAKPSEDSSHTADSRIEQFSRIPEWFWEFDQTTPKKINIIESSERPLQNVRVERNSGAEWYVSSTNTDNDHPKVLEWYKQHDEFYKRFGGNKIGIGADDLKKKLDTLEKEGLVINLDKNPSPYFAVRSSTNITPDTFTILISEGDTGIPESWRRTIRTDHAPILEEIVLRLNELFYSGGMSSDYLISPIFNSLVRAGKQKGGSSTSLHMLNSAYDYNFFGFAVHKRSSDGIISTFLCFNKDLDIFRNAMRTVLAEMGEEEKVFPREEKVSAHWHVVVAPKKDLGGKRITGTEKQKTKDFEVPRRKLKDFIATICIDGITPEMVRKYNGLPEKYDPKRPETRINPGDHITIPEDWLKNR